MAGRGSAVDAALVALAEPHGVIFTGDTDDLTKLAFNAANVSIESI
jgi:delta 1-pyrroline-5-carboxylate dehydrogenase